MRGSPRSDELDLLSLCLSLTIPERGRGEKILFKVSDIRDKYRTIVCCLQDSDGRMLPPKQEFVGLPPLRFAEFFAGIGLVRLALEELGFKCLFANDICKKKAEIYSQNFPSVDLHVGDVNEIRGKQVPDVDMITASFPCIDLSLAGNRAGLKGKSSGTFWAFIRILEEMKSCQKLPKVVLIENVTGFLSSHQGHDFHRAVEALNKLGYLCDAVVLDAVHFTPQSRKRLFLLGTTSDTGILRELNFLESTSELRPPKLDDLIRSSSLNWGRADLPTPPPMKSNLSDILEDIPAESPLWWSEEKVSATIESMSSRDLEKLSTLQALKVPSFGTIYRRRRNQKTVAELRIDGVAGCLRTPTGGSSKQFLLRAESESVRVRNMTPREYGRLQGVPDSFKIQGRTNQILHGFGDAVCTPAVRWLIQNFLSTLDSSMFSTKSN